jgi:hypothetical protein
MHHAATPEDRPHHLEQHHGADNPRRNSETTAMCHLSTSRLSPLNDARRTAQVA